MPLLFGNTASAGSQLVTNDLLVHYDITQAASYPGSGTTIFDLAGAQTNQTLYNGPSYVSGTDASINYDGVDDYSSSGATPSELQGNPSLTVSAFIKRTGTMVGNNGTWGIGGNAVAEGICSWINGRTNEICIDFWGLSTFSSGQTYPLNQWVYAVWQKTPGAFTRANTAIWVNQTKYTGTDLIIDRAESASIPALNNVGITIAGITPTYGTPFPFRMSNFLVYNRVLSDQEVLQNFNALRGRYSI